MFEETLTRRELLGSTAGLAMALTLASKTQTAAPPGRQPRSCILLWLQGGPSHIDLFDPKPDAPDGAGGPWKPVRTPVPGLQLGQHLPALAIQAKHLAVVRSLTSREVDHERAIQYVQTGHTPDETVDYPAIGAVTALARERDRGDIPDFVVIDGGGLGGGFLGSRYDPHLIGSKNPLADIALPGQGGDASRANRLAALNGLNEGFSDRSRETRIEEYRGCVASALRFARSPALAAFDLRSEKSSTLEAYGVRKDAPGFGKGCLLARRLVEHGVRFIQVTLNGWDTHVDNFEKVKPLAQKLDEGLAALVGDLSNRGLLQDTLIVCLGEFGRTPTINPKRGRDHWGRAFSAVLAGGGVRGGQVVGATDAKGGMVRGKGIEIPDLFATLLFALGIDRGKKYFTPDGRPIFLTKKARVVHQLFS